MAWLLDSNVWISLLKQRDARLIKQFAVTPNDELFACSPVRAELMHGARKYDDPEERKTKVEDLLSQFVSLPFDDRAAEVYGRIRDELERERNVIGPFDLQIAAIALAHDLTVVTSNVGEFRRVHGLKVEDWSVAVA